MVLLNFPTQAKWKKLRGKLMRKRRTEEQKTNDFNQDRYRRRGGGGARKEEIKKFLRAAEFELGRLANVYACRVKLFHRSNEISPLRPTYLEQLH